MSIPEEMITRNIDLLLTQSSPGATVHYLHVVASPADAVTGLFGVPDQGRLETSVYAIAPVARPQEQAPDVQGFVATVIATASADHAGKSRVPMFAALSQETWTLRDPDEAGRRLMRSGRLSEHPQAVETTLVYAVCADGRRWEARRDLTGEGAGVVTPSRLLVGRFSPVEGFGLPAARLLRALVGL